MVTTFSEANYEEAVLELFRNMGYQYAYYNGSVVKTKI